MPRLTIVGSHCAKASRNPNESVPERTIFMPWTQNAFTSNGRVAGTSDKSAGTAPRLSMRGFYVDQFLSSGPFAFSSVRFSRSIRSIQASRITSETGSAKEIATSGRTRHQPLFLLLLQEGAAETMLGRTDSQRPRHRFPERSRRPRPPSARREAPPAGSPETAKRQTGRPAAGHATLRAQAPASKCAC